MESRNYEEIAMNVDRGINNDRLPRNGTMIGSLTETQKPVEGANWVMFYACFVFGVCCRFLNLFCGGCWRVSEKLVNGYVSVLHVEILILIL